MTRQTKTGFLVIAIAIYMCHSEEINLLVCEDESKTVSCPTNSTIDIVSASYGYNGSNEAARKKCDPSHIWLPFTHGVASTRCKEPRSSEILTAICGGHSECEVLASNDIFGDPCRGTTKYLEVVYSCILDRTPTEQVLFTRNSEENRSFTGISISPSETQTVQASRPTFPIVNPARTVKHADIPGGLDNRTGKLEKNAIEVSNWVAYTIVVVSSLLIVILVFGGLVFWRRRSVGHGEGLSHGNKTPEV